jgi:thiol:disulfide interchange protein DsbD
MIKHSRLSRLFSLTVILLLPATLYSKPAPPQSASDVNVSGSIAPDKVKKGRVARATVVIDIPAGLHVQSNKPLDKFLVPTKLDVETPSGMNVGPISYPRALMRKLKFSKGNVAVYEGKAMIRFNVTVPANYSGGSGDIKGKLRFQACNDESCFPPVTREVKMWLNVE